MRYAKPGPKAALEFDEDAAEFEFRCTRRVANGVVDMERASAALSDIVGKRSLYRDSSGA